MPTGRTLEERVQRLEDLEQITGLFHSYRKLVDEKDFAACSQLFSEDARFLGVSGTGTGPEGVQRFLESLVGTSVRERRGDDLHLFVDPVIELDGDQATVNIAWAYFVRNENGTPQLLKTGHHEDLVRRVGDEWKIAEVRALVDMFK